MIKWLKRKLGIEEIGKEVIKSNSMTKAQLIEINKSIEKLIPKMEAKNIEIVNSFDMKNDFSNLNFKLSNDILPDENWSLITFQNSKSNFLSQIVGTTSAISSVVYSANGLYIATANPINLMTYSNGSLSSITMNGSQFGSHAGFVSANPAVFLPILAVQFASMLTGQYYFNGLTKQLTSVQKGINELINLHHNERLAKLRYINTRMSELNNRNFFTTEDYVIVDRLKYDLSIIRFEYLLSAQQEIINIFETNREKEKDEIVKISEDSNQFEKISISFERNTKKIVDWFSSQISDKLKPYTENSHKKVEELGEKVSNSKFFFYSDIALKSEQLYQLIKLLEFKINLSDKKPSYNRIGKIEELYKSIKDFNYKDSIYDEMENLEVKLKNSLLLEIERHRNNSQITRSKIDSKASKIFENFRALESILEEKNMIFDDIEKIRKGFEIPHQILIDNRTEMTKIYTKKIIND